MFFFHLPPHKSRRIKPERCQRSRGRMYASYCYEARYLCTVCLMRYVDAASLSRKYSVCKGFCTVRRYTYNCYDNRSIRSNYCLPLILSKPIAFKRARRETSSLTNPLFWHGVSVCPRKSNCPEYCQTSDNSVRLDEAASTFVDLEAIEGVTIKLQERGLLKSVRR